MDVKQSIEERRSIREFQDKEISDDLIKEIINAARLAPSGCNRQGSRYRVVSDKETIQKLKENKIYSQDFVYTAPVLIVCCYDKNAYPENVDKENHKILGTDQTIRAVRDLSIASSFIVLRAQSLGLGTCYIGWMDKVKVKQVLNIPDELDVLFTIAVGYPNEKPEQRPRKDINEIIIK